MNEIKFDDRNYRVHNDKNKRLIRKSLVECGAGRSIVLDKDDVIIAGNGVYEQARELGLKVRVIESNGSELIAIKRTDLSTGDERRKLLSLADNYTSDTSEFDINAILDDFTTSDLDAWELDIRGLDENIDFPDEFTASRKDNPPIIKLTFPNLKSLELFERELKPLVEKHEGVTYVVGCGEL